MPFTPFHLGPALLVGLLLYRWLDLPTVLATSVLVDARATLVFFGYLDPPLHGPLHTFLGSAVLAVALAGGWYLLRPWFDPLLAALHVRQPRSAVGILGAAITSVWLHVLLDAVLYADVRPFAPIADANPFLSPLSGFTTYLLVYLGCVVAGLAGAVLYGISVAFDDRGVGLDTVEVRTAE